MSSTKRIRALHIIDWLNVGGAQTQVLVFASLAQAFGIDLTVVVLGDGDETYIDRRLRELKVKVKKFPSSSLLSVSRFMKIVQYIRLERFDIIQTHLQYANILGSLAGYVLQIPVVSTLHSTGEFTKLLPLKDLFEVFFINYFSSYVIAVGYRVADVYRKYIRRKKVEVVLNAVLDNTFEGSIPDPLMDIRLDASKVVLISVGRLSPPKNFGDLLLAYSEVRKAFPNVLLLIVGNGPLFIDLQSKVREMNLTDSVFLLGERDDVPLLLHSSDIFVISSIWEGLPMAILEAMMAGLPIVATDVGDIAFVVPESVGYVVPPKKTQLLAEAIKSLVGDVNIRSKMKSAARSYAQLNFSAEAWMNKLTQIYLSIV